MVTMADFINIIIIGSIIVIGGALWGQYALIVLMLYALVRMYFR